MRGEDLADAFFIGFLWRDNGEPRALGVPAREERKKIVARLLLRAEALLGDEVVGRVVAVVGEAFGVPGYFGEGGGGMPAESRGFRRVEERGGLVDVGKGVEGGDTG